MPAWEQADGNCKICHVASESETYQVAGRIADLLLAGDVIALIGDLGAGKTQFVKAVAAAWGVPLDEVNSPTFTLIQEYAGRVTIRHCDAYRLRTPEEFADLGLDELFASDGIALVEWADRVTDYMPCDCLTVRIKIDSPTERTFDVSAVGLRSCQILSRLW